MASSDKTPQVTGLLITNFDFPRPLIRDAMVGGGFSITDEEYVPRQNGSLIIWLQSKSKYKQAKNCLAGYQLQGHKKLWAGPLPKDSQTRPAPAREPYAEYPKIKSVQEELRKLVSAYDAAQAGQPALPELSTPAPAPAPAALAPVG